MKYLIVGPTIVNDILYENGSVSKRNIGGSIFCLEGVKIWTDDCLYISNVGADFSDYYGKWMEDNHCLSTGLQYILPHTQYTLLTYGEEGLHSEKSIYGSEEEKRVEELDIISARQVAEYCNEDTKGIYIEASETNEFWNGLSEIRNKSMAKIIWEIPTSAAMIKERKSKVLEIIKKVDLYSINLPEGMSLFEKNTEEEVIEEIIAIEIPCFFRVGKRGSYMIIDGKAHFAKSLLVGEIVDSTGCGNCSTAAAMYAFCEGYEEQQIAVMANIAAAYNLLQRGPYRVIGEDTRKQAWKLVEENIDREKALSSSSH